MTIDHPDREALLPFHLQSSAAGTLRDKSFSGVDIKVGIMMQQQETNTIDAGGVQIPFQVFAEIQTLSITSFRSVGPVRCLGESQPRTILRGARTIGGSLVFAQFDENAFQRMMRVSDTNEVYNADEPFFIDQMPPFDIIASGSNEYGNTAMLMVGGVSIGQTGTTLSVHDIYTEATYSYTARYYIPWSPAGSFKDVMRDTWWEQRSAASGLAYDYSKRVSAQGLDFEGNPSSWMMPDLVDRGEEF